MYSGDSKIHEVNSKNGEPYCEYIILNNVNYVRWVLQTTCKLLTVPLFQPVKMEATGRVNPSKSIAAVPITVPNSMYGLLRPNREVEVSVNTPISGWIMRPKSGSATNTAAILDLDIPSDNKYGMAIPRVKQLSKSINDNNVPYDTSTLQNICTPNNPIVMVGNCAHRGPRILATPLNRCCRSSWPSAAMGTEVKPVIQCGAPGGVVIKKRHEFRKPTDLTRDHSIINKSTSHC